MANGSALPKGSWSRAKRSKTGDAVSAMESEFRIAKRMARLGTETAFQVLVKVEEE
jgi:flagellar motility protein MotE (MotC chaperone)